MSNNISHLIAFIVCYASEREITLTTLRLVKFIYLADLYFARYTSGETFTGFPWKFVHYGPYCAEALESINYTESEGYIQAESIDSKFRDRDYTIFTCKEEDSYKFKQYLPDEMISQLQKSIKRFGDDTPALLDYVYFDTEPMAEVKKGDLLDFRRAKPLIINKSAPVRKLSKAEIQEGKKHIKALVDRFRKAKDNLTRDDRQTIEFRDELYYDTIEAIDAEELHPGLTGVAHIMD